MASVEKQLLGTKTVMAMFIAQFERSRISTSRGADAFFIKLSPVVRINYDRNLLFVLLFWMCCCCAGFFVVDLLLLWICGCCRCVVGVAVLLFLRFG
jgi:hypothetical protein